MGTRRNYFIYYVRNWAEETLEIKLTHKSKLLEFQKDIVYWQGLNTPHIYRLKYLNWAPSIK